MADPTDLLAKEKWHPSLIRGMDANYPTLRSLDPDEEWRLDQRAAYVDGWEDCIEWVKLHTTELFTTVVDPATLVFPEGWEVDVDEEGGQPNGLGELEPSDYRDWFTDERETHHRKVVTLTGPWEEGARASVQKVLAQQAKIKERAAKEREDRVLREAEEIQARRAKEANSE